ncbi:MAG: DUF4159 domain-containing protein [Alphaproteobacteria bacterium]
MALLDALAFTSPWVLTALVALPALWWLIRLVAPAPRRRPFPALRILQGLMRTEDQAARSPWWLLLLRFAAAAAVIIGLAGPVLNPPPPLPGNGPLILIVDNGWAAAGDWAARLRTMDRLLTAAEGDERAVLLLETAPPPGGVGTVAGFVPAEEARRRAQAIVPRPWDSDLAAFERQLDGATEAGRLLAGSAIVWLSDGLERADMAGLATRLRRIGSFRMVLPEADSAAMLMRPPQARGNALQAVVERANADGPVAISAIAQMPDGRIVAEAPITFATGEQIASAEFLLPLELRNRLERIAIAGRAGAGAVHLLDEQWRRRPVGLVASESVERDQPLLAETFYLGRALEPFSDIRRGELGDLTEDSLSVIVLPDIGTLTPDESRRAAAWIEQGGVLLRFAGERLTEGSDDLLPVRLRRGGRFLGGALNWDQPQPLAPFAGDSPFSGLSVPADVTVRRQVLAEPDPALSERTWARLADGTPLVTGEQRGQGWLVLVHTTANTDWSNLALSGLFVDMLRRVIGLSAGVAGLGQTDRVLQPIVTLDGLGRLGPPPTGSNGIATSEFDGAVPGATRPPGYYGAADTRFALNLNRAVEPLATLSSLPPGLAVEGYSLARSIRLMPWLLTAAFVLLLADLAISLHARGLLSPAGGGVRRSAGLAMALWLAAALTPDSAVSQTLSDDDFALAATLDTRLAYVLTGDDAVDAISRAGLYGLSLVLARRTGVEPLDPLAVDLEHHDLSFFPLLYWPVTERQAILSAAAIGRINAYMRNGGTILFDTRDQNLATTANVTPGVARLRKMADGLDVPPLMALPEEHVLTRSFYLLQHFPGRYEGGALWVERTSEQINDGVSGVIIGFNDYAAAWATDLNGNPLLPVNPGGERQREMAYRFGVNLVMYALTGNYKSDQVHVPAILERLGQ